MSHTHNNQIASSYRGTISTAFEACVVRYFSTQPSIADLPGRRRRLSAQRFLADAGQVEKRRAAEGQVASLEQRRPRMHPHQTKPPHSHTKQKKNTP